MDGIICGSQKGENSMESISFPLCSFPVTVWSRYQPPCCPPTDLFPLWFCNSFFFVRGYRLSHRSMRNRETDRQADRQTNDVWADDEYSEKKRGGQRERSFIVLLQGEHTYPVRLNQKRVVEEDGRWEKRWGEGEDGWVKGRKYRMKKERGGQIRLRQSEQV